MSSPEKPVPHPTAVSQPYWDGTAAGQLVLQRCSSCGRVRHYPQLVCPKCHSLGVEAVVASGQGTVHSWTVAHHAFHPAFSDDLPYTLVIVDLAEGPRALGRFDPAAHEHLRIGLRVRVRFVAGAEGVALPVFVVDED